MEESIEEEIWRDVDGYDYYQVSSLGRVKSLDKIVNSKGGTRMCKGKILKPQIIKNGYLQVNLSKDGKRTMFFVHRLVGIAFQDICGEYKDGLEIDHRNTSRTDNRAVNLHWVTRKENNNNQITRQCKSNAMYGKFGKDHPASKAILQYDLEGNFIAEWDSASSAERQLGIWSTNISACCKGKHKTAGGFIFKYKTA